MRKTITTVMRVSLLGATPALGQRVASGEAGLGQARSGR